MVTKEQEKYLKTIPIAKLAHIQPYSTKIGAISGDIINKIRSLIPVADVAYIGASALKISGQNDIDVNVLTDQENFEDYKVKLTKLFGSPTFIGTSIEWEMKIDGLPVTVYLTDKHSKGIRDQIKIYDILKNNTDLLAEYENIKSKYNNLPYRDYQKAKYEFYNKLI